jgi:hypothetical protein
MEMEMAKNSPHILKTGVHREGQAIYCLTIFSSDF